MDVGEQVSGMDLCLKEESSRTSEASAGTWRILEEVEQLAETVLLIVNSKRISLRRVEPLDDSLERVFGYPVEQ